MNNATTIMVVILLLGFVAITSLAPLAKDFMGDISDWINYGWNDSTFDTDNATDTNGDTTNGDSGTYNLGSGYVGATILYTDGTTKHFKLGGGLSLLPLSLWDSVGQIASVTVELWIYAEFSGTLSAIETRGTLDVDLGTLSGDGLTFTSDGDATVESVTHRVVNPAFSSGDDFKVWETTYGETEMENWFFAIYGTNIAYKMRNARYKADVTVTFEWGDGHDESASLSASTVHALTYLEDVRLESVSLTINPNILYTT